MWAVFGRSRDPRVNELMAEAEPLLHGGTEPLLARALEIYSEVVAAQPSFAEVWGVRVEARCARLGALGMALGVARQHSRHSFWGRRRPCRHALAS
jgi:hypothetical protein